MTKNLLITPGSCQNLQLHQRPDEPEKGLANLAASLPSTTKYAGVDWFMAETGWARQTVYQRSSAGTIPGLYKVGRRLRFDRQMVLDWIARNGQVPE